MWPGDEETRRHARVHGVARDLLANEAVVRQVVVEGAHDVVAVLPGVFSIQIGFRSVGFRPADDVEPMLRPPFSELRGSQEPVDKVLVSFSRPTGEVPREDRSLLGSRRHSSENDRGATEKGGRVGSVVRGETRRLKAGVKKGVDRMGALVGNGRLAHRLEGPMIRCELGDVVHLSGPRRALLNPALKKPNLIRAQWRTLGRHSLVRVVAGNEVQEVAFLGMTGRQRRRAGVTSAN